VAALVASTLVAMAAPLLGTTATATASPVATGASSYRHGAVRPVGPAPAGPFGAQSSAKNLTYGGGNAGVGVTTGAPKVYLVLWGSQWGTQGTNGQGNATLSGDSKAMAPDMQAFFKGIGTASEQWSGVMTEYCEGVATGAQTCPAASAHVGYPSGGALAGVWADTTAASPASATGHQLAVEAVNAANHFGNTTQDANRNTQYFVVSPPGTTPDGFHTAGGNFCAWHDFSADPTLPGGAASSPFAVAFTNMPYVTDAGGSCGMNFVNSGAAGTLDGVTIVGGHEYAETITDQFPNGGWLDGALNENGDKCSWISSGQGASQNITLTTGSFAVQSTWANDFNGGSGGCLIGHAIVVNPAGTCTPAQLLGNPGFETGNPVPWVSTTGVVTAAGSQPAHTGNWMAHLAGHGFAQNDWVRQKVAVPAGCTTYTFSFWRHIDTTRTTQTATDILWVQVLNATASGLLQTLVTYSNRSAAGGFVQASFNLSAYAGQTVNLKFAGKDAGGGPTTNFVIDDTAFNVS